LVAPEADAALRRIRTTVNLADGLSRADLAIEAVPENLELKQDVFAKMETVARPGTILASNASRTPTSQIAARCNRPEHVVGIHFFDPPRLTSRRGYSGGAVQRRDVRESGGVYGQPGAGTHPRFTRTVPPL